MPFASRKLLTLSVFAIGLAFSSMGSSHAIVYSVDDGLKNNTLFFGGSPPAPTTFGNQFIIVLGGETISSISIAWGNVAAGNPMTAKLWSDPNGDGNPNDAVVLSLLAGVTANPNPLSGAVTFTTYDIPDFTLAVGQSFFVGATLIPPPGAAPMSGDATPPISNQSWATPAADFLGSIHST